jgi:hypothetical protein
MQWSTSKKKGSGKKRTKAHLRLRRAPIQLKLLHDGPAQLGQGAQVLEGRVFLHEITEKGASVFVNAPLQLDQRVALSVDGTKKFFVNGIVDGCRPILPPGGLISTVEKFNYRLKLAFKLDTAEQRADVAKFAAEVRALTMPGLAPLPAPAAEVASSSSPAAPSLDPASSSPESGSGDGGSTPAAA